MPRKSSGSKMSAPKKKAPKKGGNLKDRLPTSGKEFGNRIVDTLKDTHNFFKKNKVISTGLSLIPHPIGLIGSKAVGAIGYGMEHKSKKKPADWQKVTTGIRIKQ